MIFSFVEDHRQSASQFSPGEPHFPVAGRGQPPLRVKIN
jgi:hypothetical protein